MEVIQVFAEIVDNGMKKDLAGELLSGHMFNMLFNKDPFRFSQTDFFVRQISAHPQSVSLDFWFLDHALIVAEKRKTIRNRIPDECAKIHTHAFK